MADPGVRIVEQPIRRSDLATIAEQQFGDMVKVVVDVARRIMAVGGELHSDEESVLLESGSRQADLWGLDLHVEEPSGAVGQNRFDDQPPAVARQPSGLSGVPACLLPQVRHGGAPNGVRGR